MSITREHKFLSENRGNLCVEEFRWDSMPPVWERWKWIREVRGERLQGVAECTSSAPRLANSSAASFPGRNECPGIHCSLIEQEEKEDSSCQICQRDWGKRKNREKNRVVRAERESERRRRKEKWQACWCCWYQQRACRMAQASAEKL